MGAPYKYDSSWKTEDLTAWIEKHISHSGLSDMPDVGGTNTDHDLRYLTLDQTTPQTIVNGIPDFSTGIHSGKDGIYTDAPIILGKRTYDLLGVPTTGYVGLYHSNDASNNYSLKIDGSSKLTLIGRGITWTQAGAYGGGDQASWIGATAGKGYVFDQIIGVPSLGSLSIYNVPTTAISIANRQLIANDGTGIQLDWATDGTLNFQDNNLTTTGDVEADALITTGGLSTDFVKGDGSLDSNTYLTAEADTIDDVLGRGDTSATENLTLTAGTLTAEHLKSTDDLEVADDILLGSGSVINFDSGNATITHSAGILTFNIFPVTPSAAPDADYEVANKKYVDDNAGGGETLAETLAIGADANDVSITSMKKLEGLDANIFIDLGNDGHIDFSADTSLDLQIGGVEQIVLTDGKLAPTTDSDIDLGDGTHYFKDAYIDTVTTTGNVVVGGDFEVNGHATFDAEVANTVTASACTVDWGAGNKQKLTLDDDCEVTFTAPDGVGNFLLHVIQDAGGANALTFATSIKWVGGATPTFSTDGDAEDILTFYYDGSSYFGVASLAFAVPA